MNNKPTKEQLNDFVDHLIYTNEMIWNAICNTGDLCKTEVYKYIVDNDEDDIKDILKQIVDKFKIKAIEKQSDSDLAKPELYGENFEKFEALTGTLDKFLNI
jgi:hypothetical protein